MSCNDSICNSVDGFCICKNGKKGYLNCDEGKWCGDYFNLNDDNV